MVHAVMPLADGSYRLLRLGKKTSVAGKGVVINVRVHSETGTLIGDGDTGRFREFTYSIRGPN